MSGQRCCVTSKSTSRISRISPGTLKTRWRTQWPADRSTMTKSTDDGPGSYTMFVRPAPHCTDARADLWNTVFDPADRARGRKSEHEKFCRFLYLARRANKEDHCTGPLSSRTKGISETSILACAIHVERNPIRAAITRSPEESCFTSAFERIQARKKRTRRRSHSRGTSTSLQWLYPVELQGEERSLVPTSGRRTSNRGFLQLNLAQYLQLLDWTAHRVRYDKCGASGRSCGSTMRMAQSKSARKMFEDL